MSSAQANAQAAPSNGQQTMPGGPNGPQAIPAGLPSELANMPPEQLAALIQDLPNMLKNVRFLLSTTSHSPLPTVLWTTFASPLSTQRHRRRVRE